MISNKSQGSVWWVSEQCLYYKIFVEFVGKIGKHLAELQARRLIVSCTLCIWALSCLKMKNWSEILCMMGRSCCYITRSTEFHFTVNKYLIAVD